MKTGKLITNWLPFSYTDDTSLFSVVFNVGATAKELNVDLAKVQGWALYLLRKLRNLLPRAALLTLYKPFIRPYLDYGDIIYEQAFNSSFHEKLEPIQYKASLAITGAIRGTSREKLYNELGFESLHVRL